MKRFIIHIGQSKTGTTSLQLFLSENRQNLIKQRICNPNVKRGGMTLHMLNHNSTADSLTGNDAIQALVQKNILTSSSIKPNRRGAAQYY